ncbi:MAG: hypothetical protein ACTSRA_22110 [Promethearchaeota archaeon]
MGKKGRFAKVSNQQVEVIWKTIEVLSFFAVIFPDIRLVFAVELFAKFCSVHERLAPFFENFSPMDTIARAGLNAEG